MIYSRQIDECRYPYDGRNVYSRSSPCSRAGAIEISAAKSALLLVSLSLFVAMICYFFYLRRDTANFSLASSGSLPELKNCNMPFYILLVFII